MAPTSLFACRDPRAPWWQLGPLPPTRGRLLLIGWRQQPPAIDAGVPAVIARVLARALTGLGWVIFPSSQIRPPPAARQGWVPLTDVVRGAGDPMPGPGPLAGPAPGFHRGAAPADALTRVLTCRGLTERLGAALRRQSARIALCASRRAELACGLFDDAAYPWWLQGQNVLLAAPAQTPPDLNRQDLLGLWQRSWTAPAAALALASGLLAVMRPGVDGAVAGLLCLEAGVEEALLAALAAQAAAAEVDWAIVPEASLFGDPMSQ